MARHAVREVLMVLLKAEDLDEVPAEDDENPNSGVAFFNPARKQRRRSLQDALRGRMPHRGQ